MKIEKRNRAYLEMDEMNCFVDWKKNRKNGRYRKYDKTQ